MMNKNSNFCGCLYFSTNALARILNSMAEKEFMHVGLSPSYAFLIMAVAKTPGIHPKELSKELELKPSSVTRLIEKLENNGLVFRKPLGKVTEVYLTEKGTSQLSEIQKCWHHLYLSYSKVIGEKEGNKLAQEINAVALILEPK